MEIHKGISEILPKRGFELRKSLSNDEGILNKFCTPQLETTITIGEYKNNKNLGIYWNARCDILQFSVNNQNSDDAPITKGRIWSIICQIYNHLFDQSDYCLGQTLYPVVMEIETVIG